MNEAAGGPAAPRCRYCETTLGRREAGRDHCGAPACMFEHVQTETRAFFALDWDDMVAHQHAAIRRAGNAVPAAAAMLGLAPRALPTGVVPRQERPLVPLPDDRRAAFLENLEWVVEQSFNLGDPPEATARNPAVDAEEPALTGAACAACQGLCCILGGRTHAFLKQETIDHFRRQNPGVSRAGVIAHYISRLPPRSVEHSCVYHGPLGCALKRNERAAICNVHQCSMKKVFKLELDETGADRAAWIGHSPDGRTGMHVCDRGGRHRPVPDGDTADCDPADLREAQAAIIARQPQKLTGLR